ncbi:hypothetical protein TorRG33x02_008350 [Trema orientale]|uniref:DUF1985 domain-containing protein n=1 Tax=Trema orientale TaxID=63057 RepID=A0A2P5G0Q3_TREOI|nr:hypothetical protein TorRG33x02_008350 [Trema orientale]
MYMSATVMEGETLNTLEPILSPALYFETKITIRCQLVAMDVLNLHLKKSQLVERFKNSCFGHLLNMKIMSLSVDDLDLFNKYPWGKESFRELIKSFQRDWAKKGKELKEKYAQRKITRKFFTYAIYGFRHALQVWAYEAIPLVASKFAIKESITVPRIIGWDAKLKPSATEIDDVLNSNNQLIVMPILLPRVNELTRPFFTTMASLGKDRVDEVIDQIIHDLDREDGAFVDNMMEEDGGENLDKINESEAVKVASNENIFLEDVHMIPKNSYLTRDEFETRMIHVEEHFQFSDDCFHHDMEICGSDNEDIEAVIHSTAREIPDSPKTPTSLVFSDDDNFQNPSSPESCEIKFPEGRGHRFRKHSKVYRSPYTCPSKRRKLKDPIDFDPFRPLDRAKANDFCIWIKNYKPGDSVNLVLLEAQRNWFKKILKSKAMLEDKHVDVSLYFIRKRADKYPRSFPQKCAILDSFFSQTMIGQWDNFNNWSDPQSYEFDSTCLSYVFGSSPRLGRKWSECEKLGNCGIFAIKHIEFLSAGLTLEKVTDEQIAFFRAEMATEIFALDFDP